MYGVHKRDSLCHLNLLVFFKNLSVLLEAVLKLRHVKLKVKALGQGKATSVIRGYKFTVTWTSIADSMVPSLRGT